MTAIPRRPPPRGAAVPTPTGVMASAHPDPLLDRHLGRGATDPANRASGAREADQSGPIRETHPCDRARALSHSSRRPRARHACHRASGPRRGQTRIPNDPARSRGDPLQPRTSRNGSRGRVAMSSSAAGLPSRCHRRLANGSKSSPRNRRSNRSSVIERRIRYLSYTALNASMKTSGRHSMGEALSSLAIESVMSVTSSSWKRPDWVAPPRGALSPDRQAHRSARNIPGRSSLRESVTLSTTKRQRLFDGRLRAACGQGRVGIEGVALESISGT